MEDYSSFDNFKDSTIVESECVPDCRRLEMIEKQWNQAIGERFEKRWDDKTCKYFYKVPKEHKEWWTFWLKKPKNSIFDKL